jgi:hypothetical protein
MSPLHSTGVRSKGCAARTRRVRSDWVQPVGLRASETIRSVCSTAVGFPSSSARLKPCPTEGARPMARDGRVVCRGRCAFR